MVIVPSQGAEGNFYLRKKTEVNRLSMDSQIKSVHSGYRDQSILIAYLSFQKLHYYRIPELIHFLFLFVKWELCLHDFIIFQSQVLLRSN